VPDQPAEGATDRSERTEHPERVAVGRINAPWGVRGHVKVTPLTANPERIAEGATVYLRGAPTRIEEVKTPRGYPVVLFQGVRGLDDAEMLRGEVLEIDESDLPPLPEDEYYVHDLIGLPVSTTDGRDLGEVADVLQTGSNDVYVVRRPGARDVLIPVLEGIVVDVDLQAARILVEPVPGLLEGEDAERDTD
jgi:16S rRNA processing protein RimM